MFLCYKVSVFSFTCNAFLWRFFDIFTISTHTAYLRYKWLFYENLRKIILFYCICQSVSYNIDITAVINFFLFVQYDICMLDPILMQYWFYCHVMSKWDYVRHNFIDDNILLYFWSFISPWVSHSYQCHMG